MASFPTETLNLPPPINGQDSTNHNEPLQNADDEQIQPSIPQSTDDVTTTAAEKRKREDVATEGPQSESAEPSPSPSLHPLHKTSLCSYFRKVGTCCHGSTCRYAHGEEELRIRPDDTWDPTSERAKKARKLEDGDKCEAKEDAVEEVMMTEAVVDGDGDGDGDQDVELSKCLVHLPRKWHSDNLKKFLADHVSAKTVSLNLRN